ncbi:fatty acyl-AMP ligase [Ferruginibacter paludis]|uniref:fatty acyl-AMP ligase n=1 Tax=Ferruginibacter paludis TaxID=1310417 RepID=UPI0025B440F6|nr:fatty acyl-AMP ligase [Ferruginibacter paludis]MDN3658656.1 fatty acyl-AMP ligase [Ferruginibacter paludis]
MTTVPNSMVDILRWRAKNQPSRLAYRFLVDGEYAEVTLTYEELDRRARSIGALLQSAANPGDRALLLLQPGLDFIVAYFGCLYAKIIAIPAYPPHPARLERTLPIIRSINADARPAVALLTSSLYDGFNSRPEIKEEFSNLKLLVTDNDLTDERADKWQPPAIGRNDIAFLQYTSGSTTLPKGVIVSHSDLLHNLEFIEKSFGLSAKSQTVFWLPPYHDMGLIGGILQSLYTGYPVTLLPHLLFLQRPIRWLQAISRFHATCSGGPNFAYELCIRKIKQEQIGLLDLSGWEVAFNGAEPVYNKTMDQFADYFAPCGFRREAFLPCYGLAEATLMVAGGPKGRPPIVQHLVTAGIEQNKVIISPAGNKDATRTLVGCGQNRPDQKIRIVDIDTFTTCPSDQIGEIWVSGPGIAGGYWNKPSESKITFGARLSSCNEGPFLRTGDVGFLHEGELYITGRLKNLIISGGKNHYAHDIEWTVQRSHPAIRLAGCAVFSINKAGGEDIIVVAEMEHKLIVKAEEVIKAIRQSIAIHHELQVADIKLIHPGGIPKTTSGKIRHFLCKNNYMAGALEEITCDQQ